MPNTIQSLLLLTSITICQLMGTPAASDEPIRNVGEAAFDAWYCAALNAEGNIDTEEFMRLWGTGYGKASLFVEADQKGEVTPDDWNNVPVGLVSAMSAGPSVEFILGVIWARIEQSVKGMKDALAKDMPNTSAEDIEFLRLAIIKSVYVDLKCASLP
jgi:hypothetical protein